MIKVKINKQLNEISSSKSLFVFDFDDTIARSDSKVFLVRDNERIEMDSAKFADYQYQNGDEMDFSDFNRVDAEIIPNTLAILDAEMTKGHKIVIVTARPPGAIEGIKTFFRQNGMTPPDIYATSGSENKPPVLKDLLQQGNYGRVIVYEDCRKNIESLKPVADEMGIPYTAICVEKNAQMRKVYENKQKQATIKIKIGKTIEEELSKEEEKFFGDEIKALVDNPDELYYVKTVEPRNPYVPAEERQFLNRRWLEDNVGRRLGGGSFRDAYQIKSHPDKILKISNRYLQYDPLDGQEYTTIAEDTNMLEIQLFNKYPDYFPKVYISDINVEGGNKVAKDLGVTFLEHDVTNPDRWQEVIAEIKSQENQLNILVNNAGIGYMGDVEGTTNEAWEMVHKIDLDSVFYGCKYALPLMRDSGNGSIINISSICIVWFKADFI